MARQIYTVPEIAEMLGISRSSAYKAVHEGQIEALRVGNRILVPRPVLQQMLEAKKVAPSDVQNTSPKRRVVHRDWSKHWEQSQPCALSRKQRGAR